MNKLSKKLFLRISLVILIVFSASYMLNNYFLYRYYLYVMKGNLSKIAREIEAFKLEDNSIEYIEDAIEKIEEKYNMTIVYEALNDDLEYFTESLIDKFEEKRISLNKFWVGEDKYNRIKRGKRVNSLFNQGKLKSSFLVTFIKKENVVVAAGVAITHDSDTIKIINQFYLYLIGVSIILIIILVWFYSKQITQPLEKLKNISIDISNLNFKKVTIETGDEIEELGDSINVMSEKLQKAQSELEEKNENLKVFISNISHELKTPLALVKAYSMGIKDNLDDGTYIDTILKQVDNISDLVDNLLRLSKLEKDTIRKEAFSVEGLFLRVFDTYRMIIEKENISVSVNKDDLDNPYIWADEEKIKMVLNNLIHNAIKYTTNDKIEISIKSVKEKVLFTIKNGANISDKKHFDRIWEPFYVVEDSRDKKISGTGLGLSIVSTILKSHDVEYGVNLSKKSIEFYILFEGISYGKS